MTKNFLLSAFCLFLLALFIEVPLTEAHSKKNRKPTKAKTELKKARQKLDLAKKSLSEAGKYSCCTKPTCDMCIRSKGECTCAEDLKQERGVCGQCVEGWQIGRGSVKGFSTKDAKLYAPQNTLPPKEASLPEEYKEARQLLNTAKKTMVSERNYACCIKGGCDTCSMEGGCSCGTDVAETTKSSKSQPSKKDSFSEGEEDEGVCGECLHGWHAGKGLFAGIDKSEIKLARMDSMPSSFGIGTMFRQGSGTSWLPESSAMYAYMKDIGQWMVMLHPYLFTTYTNQTGPRGDSKLYSANWLMSSAQRRVKGLTKNGDGTLLIRGMFSLDPLTVRRDGYPLLFQTGETNRGRPLIDRQHPHNMFMELAVAYSAPITKRVVMSIYAAPVGEPALGPVAFPHRLSAMDNPEAPLGHHWQDSTHIAYGVATLGFATKKMKLEGSIFTGAEPGENRLTIGKPKFDSWATRFSYNPHKDISMQTSYGHLRQPEALEPDVNIHRITSSITYNKRFEDNSHWASTFIWGRNEKRRSVGENYGTNSFLFESAYSRKDKQTLFMRFERVEKDELFVDNDDSGLSRLSVASLKEKPDIFKVKRLTVGGVQNIPMPGMFEFGIGGSISLHSFPSALVATYGSRPLSTNIFFRIRMKRWPLNSSR